MTESRGQSKLAEGVRGSLEMLAGGAIALGAAHAGMWLLGVWPWN